MERAKWTQRAVVALAVVGVAAVVGSIVGGVGVESVLLEVGAGVAFAGFFLWIDRQLRADIGEEIERVERDVDRKVEVAIATATGGLAREIVEQRREDDIGLFEAFEADPSPATLWPIKERVEQFGQSVVGQFKHGEYSSFVVRPASPDEVEITISQSPSGGTRSKHGRGRFTWTNDDGLEGLVQQVHDMWQPTGMYPGDDGFERFADVELVPGMVRQFRERIDEVLNPPVDAA